MRQTGFHHVIHERFGGVLHTVIAVCRLQQFQIFRHFVYAPPACVTGAADMALDDSLEPNVIKNVMDKSLMHASSMSQRCVASSNSNGGADSPTPQKRNSCEATFTTEQSFG